MSSQRAANWESGLAIGTGTVGAVLHGIPTRHVLHLTHEQFFLPVNSHAPAPVLAPHLGSMVAALRRGDHHEADRLLRAAAGDELIWADPFVPVLACALVMGGDPLAPDTYRRSVDFLSGDATISWTDATGGSFCVTLAGRHGDPAIDLTCSSDRHTTWQLLVAGNAGDTAPTGLVGHTAGESYGAALDFAVVGPTPEISVALTSHEALRPVTATTRISAPEHSSWVACSTSGATLEFTTEGGSSTTIRFTVDVAGFASPGRSAGPTTPLDRAALIAGSQLDLQSNVGTEVSTEDLFLRARSNDADARLGLVELAYAAGRHTILSSTGELPPNLSGVWQGSWAPAWSGDYTLNGNLTAGALASAVTTGMPELRTSLIRLLDRYREHFVENAVRLWGADGWLLPTHMSSHGRANHFNAAFPHAFWVGGGGWLLRHCFDYLSATGDKAALPWIWEFAHEVMAFYTTALPHWGGQWHVAPGFSPENTPEGRDTPLSIDPTGDLTIIRDAALIACRLAHLVGDERPCAAWMEFRDHLPPFRISDGLLAEWIDNGTPENHAHRHCSHLYVAEIEGEERWEDSAIQQATRAALAARVRHRNSNPTAPPGTMEMAFGLCQLGIVAARLGDAETALWAVTWLTQEHWRPNGLRDEIRTA
ncbi:glycosyl hydrolase family 95 catalytic domain-containing protein [Tessaracoccus defluvii]|uniref:glycosyl hydrolase family 95 catalytic domain-containing protein n=1 Tax=Tessaracoccus defluvii TaxID=1285901 RepID=UPI0031DBC0A4